VLLDHSHGKDIDAADIVIRFNDAPVGQTSTADYSSIVGHKEGLRFVNDLFPMRVLKRQFGPPRKEVSYIVTPLMQKPKVPPYGDLLSSFFENVPLRYIDPNMTLELMDHLHKLYENGWWHLGESELGPTPSSGALATILALSVCNEVKAYGLAATARAAAFPYHYYDTGPASTGGDGAPSALGGNWHADFFLEKDLWRRLAVNSIEEIEATDVAILEGFNACEDSHVAAANEGAETSLVCSDWPTSATGDFRSMCQAGNSLDDGFEYVYNRGRDTADAHCGPKATCWCCKRPLAYAKIQPPESSRAFLNSLGSFDESASGRATVNLLKPLPTNSVSLF
jgi:hypothetical protein